MKPDKLQGQRYEQKYVIREDVAFGVRDFVGSYLALDEFGATQTNYSYPVHSLYLDSDNLTLYRNTINGDKNRYKLRLRFYDSLSDAPVFFEIKRRCDNVISKARGAVKRDAVESLLGGNLPSSSQMVSSNPRQLIALQEFCRHMTFIQAKPKAHVAYLREAWMHPNDNSVRITMDREVRCCPEPTARLRSDMQNPVLVFGDQVVLELKFTSRFPNWFRELVRIYGLMQCGAAKYVDGVSLIGTHRLNQCVIQPNSPPAKKQESTLAKPSDDKALNTMAANLNSGFAQKTTE